MLLIWFGHLNEIFLKEKLWFEKEVLYSLLLPLFNVNIYSLI